MGSLGLPVASCSDASCAAVLRALAPCNGLSALALCSPNAGLASHSVAQGCGAGEGAARAGAAGKQWMED
eukprot:8709052-Alexandrium_andersonii.AAC.1